MKRKIPLLLVIISLIIISLFSAAYISNVKTENDIPRIKVDKVKSKFDLCSYLDAHPTDSTKLIDAFPYGSFADSVNFWNIGRIKECLSCLDSKFSDLSANRKVLSNALTKKLKSKLTIYYESNQLDSLLILLQWAERFKNYAEIETENDLLYNSIYTYWLDIISHSMEIFTIQNPSLKYDFKYKYIRTRLVQNNAINPVKVTSSEKFIENILYNRWGHLINATWNQTNIWEKSLLFLFISIWVLGIYSFIKLIKTKIKKWQSA